MWHRRARRRLGLVTEHRKALLRSLVIGLVDNSRIRTTYPRAKEASRFADRLVTIAKRGTLHARREIISKLSSPRSAKRMVENIGPLFKDQPGGYTRVLRYGTRPGDGAEMAILEFTKVIEKITAEEVKRKEKKKKPQPEGKIEAPREKPPKAKKAAKDSSRPPKPTQVTPSRDEEVRKTKPADETQEKPEGLPREEPKKGGFLSNLRKFLTGE